MTTTPTDNTIKFRHLVSPDTTEAELDRLQAEIDRREDDPRYAIQARGGAQPYVIVGYATHRVLTGTYEITSGGNPRLVSTHHEGYTEVQALINEAFAATWN